MEQWQTKRDRALEAAAKAHAESDSPLYGGEPYTVHLLAVEEVAIRYFEGKGVVYALRLAAMMHDALEDTDITEEEVEAIIGPRATEMVVAVTDEPGRNRREKKGRTYPKIRAAGLEAIYLKLCDRIANWENCHRTGDSKHWMYYKEYWGLYGALYNSADQEGALLWGRLHELYEMSEERGEHRTAKLER